MTSFLYVVSIAFHTSVPTLRKYMDTSRKKIFWLYRSHSCTACCTSSSDLKDFMNFLVHSCTCCSDRRASPYWTFIRRWLSMGFAPSLLKTDDRTLFFFGACCKWGRHLYTRWLKYDRDWLRLVYTQTVPVIFEPPCTTTAPSCCIPASCCHLSATLQTMSITVVNVEDSRAVFRIFIALLKFSFDSPSHKLCTLRCID
jgi:hypothetical protein